MPDTPTVADVAASQDIPPSLSGRLFNRRTVISLCVAAAIVGVAVWRAPINWSDAWNGIRHANPLLYIVALLVYYASFLLRAVRWQVLLDNAGERHPARTLLGPILTSYFVNCVVPAKMGDLYRAYQARTKLGVSGSKAFGTIIAERLLDLCVLMALLLAAGAFVFHKKSPGTLIPYVIAGTLVCVGGVSIILVMRAGRGRRLLRLLPEAIFQRYESFRIGTVHSFGRYPLLLGLTVLVWACEAARLGFVVFALNDGDKVGPSQFLLIALVAALLTTVPFLPGGLGLVEAGMVGVLIAVGGVDQLVAVQIALLDRSISYGSLVVFGFIVFTVTHITAPRVRPATASG